MLYTLPTPPPDTVEPLDNKAVTTSNITTAPIPSDDLDPFADLTISTDLIPPAPLKSPGVAQIDFDGLLPTPLCLQEDLTHGCGGQLWPAGRVLGKYLLRKPVEEFAGKKIVEIGAGAGIVGLALALKHAPHVTIHTTDQAPLIPLLTHNITLNDLAPQVFPSVYDWGTPQPAQLPRHPDIVIAAECVYFEPAFPLLVQALKDLIGEATVCWFCFKKRRRADVKFVGKLRRVFRVEEVRDDPDRSVWEREALFMYRITRKE